MNDKNKYFDITKLYKVLDANGWAMGKNFMKFWADGKAKYAVVAPGKTKSTIGDNVNRGLRVYPFTWNWLQRFSSANIGYTNFFASRVNSPTVCALLKKKYAQQSQTKIVTPFNPWLTDRLQPTHYMQYIKEHQLQYIAVNPYDTNGHSFNDLVAAINGFNFFAFYKGFSLSGPAYRKKIKEQQSANTKTKPAQPKPGITVQKDELAFIPKKDREKIKKLLENQMTKSVIYVTDVGIYAGDIYEFNGQQYLATWDLKDNSVEISIWDYAWGTSDTDNDDDLAITNETYNIYRNNTGMGGDFLALSPIKMKHYPIILQVK